MWAGHFDGDVSYAIGQLLAMGIVVVVGVIAIAGRLGRRARRGDAVVGAIVVVGLVGIAIAGQFLANGRGLLGTYGQYPLRAAYVDFEGPLLQDSRLAAEQFVLDHTRDGDRIAIWTDSARLGAGAAGMQLWGKYNNLTANDRLAPTERARFDELHPTVVAMYAPTKEQVLAFWQSLPPGASVPVCTAVPYRGIGSPTLQVCVTRVVASPSASAQ